MQAEEGLCYRKEYIEACWEEAAPKHVGSREVLLKKKKDKIANEVKPTMTWYEATRHSFVSRHLARGASLDEVSAAVGHSSPIVTKRFYDHYVRRSFSPRLRAGLGLTAKERGGRVVPMRSRDDEGRSIRRDRTVECDEHGTRTCTIVCCHLLRSTDMVLGFVEDGDPDDPLALCNECEERYAREKEWNEAFKQFADLKLVCDACYAQLKELHSEPVPGAN